MEEPQKTRLRLLVAYDGGAFQGWQSQSSGNTVQDVLEKAVATLTGEHCCVHGSGRTDSGVHALGQVAHVDVPRDRLPTRAWEGALNGHLPKTVRILGVRKAPSGFHARFSATGKVYAYRVCNTRSLHPLEIGRAWHVPSPISLPLLKDAAARLTGRHDFAAFAANRGKPDENTIRTIHRITIREAGGVLCLRFEGDGFLYRMVRLLTGTMIRLAQGKQTLDWLDCFLTNPRAARTSYCAPAEGLFLVRVLYNPRLAAEQVDSKADEA